MEISSISAFLAYYCKIRERTERISWSKNALKHPAKPQFNEYLSNLIVKEI